MTVKEPLSGLGRAGTDPVIEKLDILIEEQEEIKELIEELVEKVSDLNTGHGSGFSYD